MVTGQEEVEAMKNPAIGDEEYKADLSEITKSSPTHDKEIEHLSGRDLLALFISPGYSTDKARKVAATLLEAFDNNLTDIFTASIHDLTHVKGIGFVRACRIQAAFELGKRILSFCEDEHPKITSKEDVVKLLAPYIMYLKQEEFKVILLDSKQRLINHYRVSLGGLDSTIVDPRDVLRPAIKAHAPFIILVHNHPSGDPTPSDQDILLTRQLCMSGKIVDITILDHIIIGLLGYVSMKERKLL